MPYAKANRVFETTTTTGTGSLSLAGAITGFQTFVSGIGDGNTCHYEINNGTDWEVGIGTVTAGSPDVLSRDTVLESTNADAKVNWGSGTKNVFVCFPAQTTAETDADNTFSGDNDFSGANDFSGGSMTLPPATIELFASAAQGAKADANETAIAALPFQESYTSTGQTITNAGLLTLAHGLSSEPKFMQAYLQCTTANANYSVGDKINFPLFHDYDATTASGGVGCYFDATNIYIRFGASGQSVLDKTGGTRTQITNSSWQLYVKAWS